MFPEEKGQILDRQNDTCPLPFESVDGLSNDGRLGHPHARPAGSRRAESPQDVQAKTTDSQ